MLTRVVAAVDAGGSLIALDGVDLYPFLASIELASPIVSGDQQYGAFVALNGGARHGEQGVSRSSRIPALAGLDSAVRLAGCTNALEPLPEDHAR